MHQEPRRLAENQRSLLKTLPEPVLLVHGDGRVEYMNPSARGCLAGGASAPVKKVLQDELRDIVSAQGKTPPALELQGRRFSCHVAPFSGYNGDELYWLILKSAPGSAVRKIINHSGQAAPREMLGSSKAMRLVREMAEQVGQTDASVLITGESGTGKELVADLVRHSSRRQDQPYLGINCTAINDDLLESDLFGHEKGSFTGAHAQARGKFEAVDGGTLFLDEIGDISPRMQAMLLRVLQHGEIFRVGSSAPVQVDVRLITATSVDLAKAVQDGRFRLDLFYRLNIFHIVVPPLRRRRSDILELATHFVALYGRAFGRECQFVADRVQDKLLAYDWPGNVRELENVLQRAVLMNKTGTISNDDLQFTAQSAPGDEEESLAAVIRGFNGSSLKTIVDQIEGQVIVQKLVEHGGNVAVTAERLAISKAALYEKMRRYDISAKALR